MQTVEVVISFLVISVHLYYFLLIFSYFLFSYVDFFLVDLSLKDTSLCVKFKTTVFFIPIKSTKISIVATLLHEWLKLVRLDIDPNVPKASKYFKHWLETFTNFIARILAGPRPDGVVDPNKLEILCS